MAESVERKRTDTPLPTLALAIMSSFFSIEPLIGSQRSEPSGEPSLSILSLIQASLFALAAIGFILKIWFDSRGAIDLGVLCFGLFILGFVPDYISKHAATGSAVDLAFIIFGILIGASLLFMHFRQLGRSRTN